MDGNKKEKASLSKEAILRAAVGLADESGLDALTIRQLAHVLGTAPTTIYHHLKSKGEIIDGMVEFVFSEIEVPSEEVEWTDAIRSRCLSTRRALHRHEWAAPLMESRTTPGPLCLRHHDAAIGHLRRGGLSNELVAHAFAILDAFVYGFSIQAAALPGRARDELVKVATEFDNRDIIPDFPHLAGFVTDRVLQRGHGFEVSFEFGLDILIAGIERTAQRRAGLSLR